MGRRSLFTQKELNLLFKHPPLGFTVVGITFLVLGCFMLTLETAFGILIIAGATISIVIGIILFIKGNNKSTSTDSEDMMYDDRRELPATYQLSAVSFDEKTRRCKVTFIESKKYRTIERYVTQNYVRTPVLSSWKEKTKVIQKNIKLTNSELEYLIKHEELLIREFAFDIVTRIGNSDLFPSWYKKQRTRKQYEANAEKRKQEIQRIQNLIISCKTSISQLAPRVERTKAEIGKNIVALEKQKNNLIRSLERANEMKPSILFNIITVGIYNYLRSERRKAKLIAAINTIENNIKCYQAIIDGAEAELAEKTNRLLDLQKQEEECQASVTRDNEREHEQMMSEISRITPLPIDSDTGEHFVLLKQLLGAEYKKIVGCYIIKNNENGKCYVGQSKDIIKRIKQHFKGTEPHNIIFAEDYYSSKFRDKSTLFSVLIIPTSVADLDDKERELIELYDTFKAGYNSTSGNK